MRGTVRLIADVDPEVKAKVKAVAELEDATIKDVLVTAVNDFVDSYSGKAKVEEMIKEEK